MTDDFTLRDNRTAEALPGPARVRPRRERRPRSRRRPRWGAREGCSRPAAPLPRGKVRRRAARADSASTRRRRRGTRSRWYNNFYEFAGSDDKDLPSKLAPDNLMTRPWNITVDGECARADSMRSNRCRGRRSKSASTAIAALKDGRWSSRGSVSRSQPSSRGVSPPRKPGTWRSPVTTIRARCQELASAVRLAVHRRAADGRGDASPDDLAVGLYREPLPHQNGAPIRLVVPWKYGFKSIKSIVGVRFVEEQPVGTYQSVEPDSYGFYANVNPSVPTPAGTRTLSAESESSSNARR